MYSWDDKKAECYRLYVEENKNLDEVISYWEVRGFTPSKRAFQTQFKRWEFPSKQNPAHKNPAIVARLQELWEQNYTQKDMIEIMQQEGYPINDRELIRLRLRLKLLLRESVPRPRRKQVEDGESHEAPKKKRAKVIPGRGLINQLGNDILLDSSSSSSEDDDQEPTVQETTPQTDLGISEVGSAPLSTEELLRKQLRQEQLLQESEEKWRTRKRRRRTRGWAGLPADAPGEPPRFPSETTLDEAKAHLGLDNDMYRKLRERFLEICKQEDVAKKTVAGPEKWAQIIQQLIQEDSHLISTFQDEPEVMQTHDALFRPKGQKALSIDVICMDVTKRLRTLDNRMTLADAKNVLGLNPEQTRQVRSALTDKLEADHFTNKYEAGEQHWADLKTAWVNESDLLTKAVSKGETDEERARELKAIEVLARDVMKRLQQKRIKRDPGTKKQVHQGPGPGPAPPTTGPHNSTARTRSQQDIQQASNATTAAQSNHNNLIALAESADLQIDPSLLLAASDAAVLPSTYQPDHQYHTQDQYQHQQAQLSYHQPHTYTSHSQTYYPAAQTTSSTLPPSPTPLPIYFRLHPRSSTPFPSKTVWLSILHSPSVAEIHNLSAREHPGTTVLKLEGLIAYRGDQGEREVTVEVGDDEELGAYLGHVKSAGTGQGKATFVVMLGMNGGGFV